MLRRPSLLAILLALPLAAGCVGEIRATTTTRTSTEQLLISTAAERAIARFAAVEKELKGKRVVIDDSRYESYDKPYVVGALRHYLSEHGARLETLGPGQAAKDLPIPDRVVEVRNGGLGINDKSWGLGIPSFPLPLPNTTLVTKTPALYLIYRDKQEGWAKLQLWIFDPAKEAYVAASDDLWGRSYLTRWTFLFVGPFDFSNDIYPSEEKVKVAKKP
jgi:hypothetical protein